MDKSPILLITEDMNLREELKEALHGKELIHVLTADEARERLGEDEFSVSILDWEYSKNPLQDIKQINAKGTEPPVVAVINEGAMDTAAGAMSVGAFDYIPRPIDPDKTLAALNKAVEAGDLLKEVLLLKPRILGKEDHPSLIVVLKELARSSEPVLIRGEPGTGVELMARALHFNGPRRDGSFVSVDCSALPPHLMESEIFGFEKGAVAGGVIRKSGQAELAAGGTLFLKEVAALSLLSQQRLTKAIMEDLLEPVGAENPLTWECRLLASTELNLEENIRNRLFREDLHRFITDMTVYLPPLRERKEDIPELVSLYLETFRRMHKRGPIIFSDTIMRRLADNPWAGNLKELQKTIERYVIAGTLPQVTEKPTLEEVTGIKPVSKLPTSPPKPNPLKEAARAAEREAIINTLRECGGNKRMAARTLRISYKTLFNKLHQFNIVTKTEYE